MKVAPLITVALFLCIAFPGPIQAKKKFCMGKNGNKYAVGNGYDDKEGEVCIRYKCVKKKKKVIMKEMKCNLSCTSTQSTLSSNGFKYHKTKLKNDITKMEVVQKISKSSCIQGFSFGFKGPEAWVDNGCRAKFRFSFCKSEIGTTLQPVTCPPVPTCPTVTTCPDKTCPSIPSCPTFSPKTTCPPNPTCPATPTCPTVPEQTTCPEKSCPPIPTCPTSTCTPSPTSPTNGAIPTTTAITSAECETQLTVKTANAIDNNAIGGVLVTLVQHDAIISHVTTDSAGQGHMTSPRGQMILTAEMEGFTMAPVTFTVGEEGCEKTIKLSLSPDTSDSARVVMNWVDLPTDLDLHVKQLKGGSEVCHCFYSHKECDEFVLDVDNTNGGKNGAETITWSHSDESSQYLIFVKDFTGDATHLSGSGARVALYNEGQDPTTVNVPANGSSNRYWKVRCYNSNGFMLINQLVANEPSNC